MCKSHCFGKPSANVMQEVTETARKNPHCRFRSLVDSRKERVVAWVGDSAMEFVVCVEEYGVIGGVMTEAVA